VSLESAAGFPLYLMCDDMNLGRSMKLRAARSMTDATQTVVRLRRGFTIVESSGYLGIAVAFAAASQGYRLLCIVDPTRNRQTRAVMASTGAQVEVVTGNEDQSHLAARRARARRFGTELGTVWLNQCENVANPLAHYLTTARAIDREFPDLDVLFVGAGTGGTAIGCRRYFAEAGNSTRVVAVDSVGSVNFGGARADRQSGGLGASGDMTLIEHGIDEVEWVEERNTVLMCWTMARHGLLVCGSSGTMAGAWSWLQEHVTEDGMRTSVDIGPGTGLFYFDSIRNADRCESRFPRSTLETDPVDQQLLS